jgi:hypothetical protein
MTNKITIKLKKSNAVFDSGNAAYDDKRALYSDEAKDSINKSNDLLHELNVFTSPIQTEWDPTTFILSVHKFIDPDQMSLYWAIHQLITEATNSQPSNGWEFLEIIELDESVSAT